MYPCTYTFMMAYESRRLGASESLRDSVPLVTTQRQRLHNRNHDAPPGDEKPTHRDCYTGRTQPGSDSRLRLPVGPGPGRRPPVQSPGVSSFRNLQPTTIKIFVTAWRRPSSCGTGAADNKFT